MNFLLYFLFSDVGSESHFKTISKGVCKILLFFSYYLKQPLFLCLRFFITFIIKHFFTISTSQSKYLLFCGKIKSLCGLK